MTIGETIKQARIAAGLTQVELGKRLGLSKATVSQYENGKHNPKIETLQRIAAALGAEIGERLGLTEASVSQYESGKRNPKIETLQRIAAAPGVDIDELLEVEVIMNREDTQQSSTKLLDTLKSFVIHTATKEDATPAELDAMARVAKVLIENYRY